MVSIDSCKLRFELSKVRILSDELQTYYGECKVDKYGDIDSPYEIGAKEFKRKAFKVMNDGITTRYDIVKRKTNESQVIESLLIMFNSKLLEHRYFEGITLINLDLIYEKLMQQRIVSIPYNDFILGDLTDCDIKKDFDVDDLESQFHIVDVLKGLTQLSQSKDKGCVTRKTPTNVGIQWSKREHANNSTPLVKVYAKDLELANNSALFKDCFIKGEVRPMMRLECTIKNKSHFRYLTGADSFQSFTLFDLLDLKSDGLSDLLGKMIHCHLETYASTSKVRSGITVSEVFCCALLSQIKLDYSEKFQHTSPVMALIRIKSFIKNDSQMYKAKQIIYKCWDNYVCDKPRTQADRVDKLLQYIFKF